jgi:hypothetical protein
MHFFFFYQSYQIIKTTRAFIQIDEINQQIVIKFAVWKWIKKDIRALSKRTANFVTNGDKSFVVIVFTSGCGVKGT